MSLVLPVTVVTLGISVCEGVGRDSVGTRDMGMRSLISCMTRNIPYRIVLFIWNMVLCFMYVIACVFRQGVALVGKFFYWALLCDAPNLAPDGVSSEGVTFRD